MIKVKYPSDTKELQNKYLEIFGADLKKMRKKCSLIYFLKIRLFYILIQIKKLY